MQIIQEARLRKSGIEKELDLINKLLALYDGDAGVESIDGNMTLTQGVRNGIVSVRLANTVVQHPAIGERKPADVKLLELWPLLAESEVEFLKLPNFGRKSLNELKALRNRATA